MTDMQALLVALDQLLKLYPRVLVDADVAIVGALREVRHAVRRVVDHDLNYCNRGEEDDRG